MSNRSGNERRAQAAEEAAAWMLRLDSEQLGLAERSEFVDWLRESPLHVAEMLRMGALQDALTEFKAWDEIATSNITPSAAIVPLPPRNEISPTSSLPDGRGRFKYFGLLAASIAALAISAVLLFAGRQSDIQTQAGERRQIKLADGSFLEVAPNSALHLHMSRKARRVVLDRGEALFHVAKDPNRPFIVDAGETRVHAVGTAFSVDRSAGSVVVTVAEGKVSVTRAENASGAVSGEASNRSIALKANQQVAIAGDGMPAAVHAVNSQAELAWARGVLIFDSNSVAEVVQRFNLSNRRQIRILDPALAVRPVSGVFDASDPDSFVAFLENAAAATAVQNGRDEILVGGLSNQTSSDRLATP